MKFDPLKWAAKIPNPALQKKALDVMLMFGIPFNRWLGLRVEELGPTKVVVASPERHLRKNHLGGAHACALALLGEFPSGLLIAQNFSFDEYRLIMKELHMEYHKQGRGVLRGTVHPPTPWPTVRGEAEVWIDLVTQITNEANEPVATCLSKWQVKPWHLVRSKQA